MDERPIDDPELAELLEKRLRAQDDKREIAGVYKLADQAAKEAIARLELTDGDAVRVGRFRITRVATEPRHVEFDAAPGSRLTISLWDESPRRAEPDAMPKARPRKAKPVAGDDEADVRPTGEVNVDALRGAAERSTLDDDGPGGDLVPFHR
jgi:hypothetical protein